MEFVHFGLKVLYVLIIIFMILRKNKLGKNIELMIISMVLIFVVETITSILLHQNPSTNTTPYFVIMILGVVYALFFTYFHSIMEGKFARRLGLGLLLLHFLNYTVSAFAIKNFFTTFPQITNFISILLLLFCIVIFFRDIFDSDRILVIKNYYPFWVGVSIIIIYVGILPVIIFGARINSAISLKVFKTVILSVNLIGYSLMFITVFLANNTGKKLNLYGERSES